jgi:peptidoglycan/LPS O-acetylase OafA/YrhL
MSASIERAALPILTSLRFFAASVVVVFHFGPQRIPFPSDFFRGWFEAAYEAVSFFFVLSGFILIYVYAGEREEDGLTVKSRTFLKARIARIAPAYFLGLFLLLPPFVYSALVAKILPLDIFALGLVLVPCFLQAWYPPTALAWNAPAWSLSVEWFFYTLFPLLAREMTRLSRKNMFFIAFCMVVATAVLRGIFFMPISTPQSATWNNFAAYFPLFHLPTFVFGMALGRLYLFGQVYSPRTHTCLLSIGSIGLMLVFGCRSLFPWWVRSDALLVVLYGLVIFGGTRTEGTLRKVLALPALVFLGEASYSVYILHAPVAFWWNWLSHKTLEMTLPIVGDFFVYFGLVLGISILSFLYVERPLRRWILN